MTDASPYKTRLRDPWWPFLAAILFLALLRGGLYASALPPWGLIDEEQHLDYVRSLAESGTIPVTGQTYLSSEIIHSLFETHRWETFHWPSPSGNTPQEMGLEGYSYEGYQPPLYYALLAPVYAALPQTILGKLFTLRWLTVLLSLVTVWLSYRIVRELFPEATALPYLAALLLIAIPERTAAVSRLNNDALLEVIAAALVWSCTVALLRGLTRTRSLLIGLLFGLGMLTKPSMMVLIVLPLAVYWVHRRDPNIRGYAVRTTGIALALTLPLVIRNSILYGDPTGIAGFERITNFAAPPLNLGNIIRASADLFRNLWLVWWKGGEAGGNFVVTALIALFAFSWIGAVIGLARLWRAPGRSADARTPVLITYVAAITVSALAILLSYFAGDFPVIQGRFFLPVIVPLVALWSIGLWHTPRGALALIATIVLLLFADALNLFGNLLPYFYFWSVFVRDGVAQPFTWPGLTGAWQIFSTRLLADKPAGWRPLLMALFAAYIVAIPVFGVQLWRQGRSPDVPQQDSDRDRSDGQPTSPPDMQRPSRQWLRDPLPWIVGGLLLFYLVWVALRPAGVFWSLDEGGKFLYIQNTLRSGAATAPLAYPGRTLDPDFKFIPLFYFARAGGEIYSWWPVGFPLLSLPLYVLFGRMGLYLIPAFSGALCALFAGLLARRLYPDRTGWLAAGVALLVGVATPIAFYSTLFWEHTPAAACFMAAVLFLIYGVEDKAHPTRWLILAGILGAAATFLRTEVAGLLVGVTLALALWRWRSALQFAAAYVLACIPWLLANQRLMGGMLGRQWGSGAASLSGLSFSGLRRAGELFVPYLLFNAPQIAAYEFSSAALFGGTLLVLLACILPFIKRARWAVIPVYGALLVLTGWVLLLPLEYRSLHGFVLAAPHVVFAAWLFTNRATWRRTPFPAMVLGAITVMLAAFLARGWLAAGGLQWGPRYLLALYPLLVVASVVGLANVRRELGQRLAASLLGLYLIAAVIGAGFALRGMESASRTMRYYSQTATAMRPLVGQTIITDCTWMPMVIPELYWQGSVFIVRNETELAAWQAQARAHDIHSAQRLELDMCTLDWLNNITALRAENPGGITLQPLQLDAGASPAAGE